MDGDSVAEIESISESARRSISARTTEPDIAQERIGIVQPCPNYYLVPKPSTLRSWAYEQDSVREVTGGE